ncbi:hypothetical protein ACFQFC_08305 [Amorphoplanes digitatis]|uniref:Uncharacterized protein n=1 Tax=Actinoplanes digitatis TaxID=1868 RepID=A0A7W7I0Q5_9ACTN|nr:hypothetical protein [Actinoplanes digitatis]MBB4764206.1 hypothetical protein [Actinoplanes digitatis]GID97827.1 hypothetical protein Adi01nite_72390 [Actinoplanes digitatis]
MIALPVVLLAALVGVLLAAADSPHVQDKARIERLSTLLLVAGAVTMAGGGAFVVHGWLAG